MKEEQEEDDRNTEERGCGMRENGRGGRSVRRGRNVRRGGAHLCTCSVRNVEDSLDVLTSETNM